MSVLNLNFARVLVLTTLYMWLSSCSPQPSSDGIEQSQHFDLLIAGGVLVTGDGVTRQRADIAISGDMIAAIGVLERATAEKTIDATGLIVAPGFIDMHTHVDDGFDDPRRADILNYLMQGVTTVRTGADGSGSFNVSETAARWQAHGMGANAIMMAPHRSIRTHVMGDDQLRAPTPEEMAQMQALVETAMQEGAWGVSAQLEYGGYEVVLTLEEMIEFTRPIAAYGGFYVSHLRDEAAGLLEAIEETIQIGQALDIPVSVTHLKATGRGNWGLMRDAVAKISAARAEGLDITADQYPYLQGAPIDYITSLIDVPKSLPELRALADQQVESDIAGADIDSSRGIFVEQLQAALRDPETRALLKASTYEKRAADPSYVARWGWQDFRIKVSVNNMQYLEKNIAEIMEEEGRDGFDIIADLILSEPDVLFASASQSEADMRHALVQDWVMIASDGLAGPDSAAPWATVRAHPRSYGSQAIVLRKFVREEGLLTLEEAVRKMTSLPASRIGLTDRGRLAVGYKADIVVFDPDTIKDNATYDDAQRFASGVETLIVNGRIAIENGRSTGERAGRVLLKGRSD